MKEINEVTIDYLPSKGTTAVLTAKQGNDVLEVASVDLVRKKARNDFIADLCNDRKYIDREAIDKKLCEIAYEIVQNAGKNAGNGATPKDAREALTEMPEAVRAEAAAMLEDPNLVQRIIDDAQAVGVAGERELCATIYLCGTSRLIDKPLSVIVQGPSSSGKSYVIERVAALFPAESVILAMYWFSVTLSLDVRLAS